MFLDGFTAISGGNSSLQLARTSKGDYTWETKLYFLGNDMHTIKRMVANILKTRAILEHTLGQKVIPTDEMSKYLASLETMVEKAVSSAGANQTAKADSDM